ncbi:hypothetical protein [Helicobacter cinaedi]|uniref:hypothetical protein n=1 Tax=Helicobacter cinaedi TaxID=213 RepID=UPI000D7D1A7F|nr:hypothetical protein [Helicobacter cinaedi]
MNGVLAFIKDHLALVMFHTLLIIAIVLYPPFSIFLTLFGLAIQAIVEEFRKDRSIHITIVERKKEGEA